MFCVLCFPQLVRTLGRCSMSTSFRPPSVEISRGRLYTILDLINREERKMKVSGRNHICGPGMLVQRSDQLSYKVQLSIAAP
jgi:hypothetical protein